ncbi:MAG: NAD(+)/NADH kinase [candidate division Zixibacteria bacterium]|nr:NAD(+)/NADH kinase [candidate division Zixibacteria bacterium]
MRFGIIANLSRPDALQAVGTALDWCRKHEHQAILSDELQSRFAGDLICLPPDQLWKHIDVLVTLGGDGTMLSSVRALGRNPRPVLGINLGSLGFLTQHTPEHLITALDQVAANEYQIEERLVLKAELVNGDALRYPFALNDIVVDKGGVARVINISIYANGEYICSYTADGLIISTPTGSTAYSLAVGGPILNPTMQAIIASPISPFSLTSRPLVFPPDFELEVRIRSEHGEALLTIDGQVATKFSPRGSIRIRRAEHTMKFIKFAENKFYDILREKLHWGKQPVVDYKKHDILTRPDDSQE